VDDLLVDGQAGARGERDLDCLDAVALEERLSVVTAVEIFDGAIDVDGLNAGPSHVADEAMGSGDDAPGLAHEAEFPRRLEFRPILEELPQHA
jgi:hypothetical protein